MITDRAALLLVTHWRSEWRKALDVGDEEAAHAWSFCAENLAREMGFCGVCLGRGAEFSPESEDSPAGWWECFMCRGSGTNRYYRLCVGCGIAERLVSEEDPSVCTSCYRLRTTLPDFHQRLSRPLGAQFGPRGSLEVSSEILPGYWVEESSDVKDEGSAQS